MRRLILIASILNSYTALAETIFYGKEAREVELRSTSQTLLLFPQPPLSVSCQPEAIKFELVDEQI